MRIAQRCTVICGLFTALALPFFAAAQTAGVQTNLEAESIRDGFHLIRGTGANSNVGIFSGEDGVVVIDNQLAANAEQVVAAIRDITSKPVRYVFNTHHHRDHTGGNIRLAAESALVIAHEALWTRMQTDMWSPIFKRTTPAAPPGEWPRLTYRDRLTVHIGENAISAIHPGPAHTDGDSIILIPAANVIMTGDTFFNHRFPFVDLASGGALDGVIENTARLLELSDDDTIFIPGHGAPASRDDVVEFREMIMRVHGEIAAHIKAGHSVEETVAAKPFAELYESWRSAFMTPEFFIRVIYSAISGEPFK